MSSSNQLSFFQGLISGTIQTIVGHPLDTMKVLLQNNQKVTFSKISKLRLFNGISPVLITNSLVTGIQFYMFQNHSPLELGLVSAVISTPIEYYKIQKQTFNKYPKTIPKGFSITFLRETIALNCYFNLYNYLEKPMGVFMSGGIAGSMSWLLTYSIDTVKTRIQSGDSFKEAITKKNFNKGLFFCLTRGFIVNGFGFIGVSFIKN